MNAPKETIDQTHNWSGWLLDSERLRLDTSKKRTVIRSSSKRTCSSLKS